DNAWDGSALKSNEGTLQYTSSSSVSAGTIVSYSGSLGGEWANEDAGFNIAASGDNILVFQGSSDDPTFIYGIGWALGTSWISSGIVSTNNSYIPSGISTSDNTVVQLGTADNYQYDTDNGTSGPKSTLRYLTAQNGNYNYHNSNFFSALSGSFNVGQVINGYSGFRMMSSPVAGAVYDDILDDLWIQGMTNGDTESGTANVWTYDGSSWNALSNLNTATQTAGQGFLVYVFSDVDNDGDDDLPVYLSVSGTENSGNVTVPSSGSIADEAWEFAGNPYATTIDWDLVTQTAVTTSCYVWDSQAGTPDYISWNGSAGSLTAGLIAPYQGFFVQGDGGSGSITIAEADKSSTAGSFYKTMADSTGSMSFSISSGNYTDQAFVSFMNNGEEGIDGSDAYKLLPMTPSERVVGISYAEGNGLDINNLPYSHEGSIAIPLDVMYLTVDDDYNFVTIENDVTLTWDLSSLPETVTSLTLTDNTSGSSFDLDEQSEFTFTTVEKGSFPAYGSGGVNIYPQVGESQFTLTVAYSALTTNDDMMPKEFALHQAYPNPFNPSTTISFDIPAQTHSNASLRIYDITGRLVTTLVDEQLAPGTHTLQWQPVNLSSGLYIVQLKAGDQTFNQKITFIK
ncbi:MAG: T9SS type A sorting domain-containing protein, partial [Candidatus Marinimicrobia bacterium]|nr:T9SS type A sorting domain-containing protein [Candidatus Neomarinimicrobiota bacterium]